EEWAVERAAAPPQPMLPPSEAAPAAVETPEEMLKLVTILFAEIVASTALTPEEHRDRMRDYSAAIAPAIESEGGTIEKLAGDGIMAVFGVPTVHEDDPLRAVRAAWRMLHRLRRWNAGRVPGEALELRIGVGTGEALVSSADRHVTGDLINVAARLRLAAEPGTIVLAQRTARGGGSPLRRGGTRCG